MKEKITVYHNPRWRKSREAVLLLKNKGFKLNIVEYLKYPLDEKSLLSLSKLLSLKPKNFIRTTEPVFKQLSLRENLENDKVLFKAMAKYPKLIERPIIVVNNQAVLGRHPEKVLELLMWAWIFFSL